MPIVKKHISQALVHTMFWMLFVFVSLFLFSDFYWKENPFLQYLAILLIIVYANNFLLLPFFVKHKLYALYVFVFAGISFLATLLYCYAFTRCGCTIIKCLSDYLWQSLTPLIFLSFVWVLYRFIDKQQELEVANKERVEMELKFLKSQINPHVLFNNLNTIYSYALDRPKDVPDMILMLSDNLKYVLYESNSKLVPLEKEIHFIDNYIDFQKVRVEGVNAINYVKDIDSYNCQIAPLLLITIIENAFKHSTLNSTISVLIQVKNHVLDIVCKNDFDKEKVKSSDLKIGLNNLEKRLELIYKERYDLKVINKKKFKVSLKLQLQ